MDHGESFLHPVILSGRHKVNSILLDLQELKFQTCKCCLMKFCNIVIMMVDDHGKKGVKILTDDIERPCPDCQKTLEKQIFKSSEN